MASSGHSTCLYGVVPCYGDRFQMQRGARSPYRQTCYKRNSSSKHATTLPNFTLNSPVPHFTSFYANLCTAAVRSFHPVHKATLYLSRDSFMKFFADRAHQGASYRQHYDILRLFVPGFPSSLRRKGGESESRGNQIYQRRLPEVTCGGVEGTLS